MPYCIPVSSIFSATHINTFSERTKAIMGSLQSTAGQQVSPTKKMRFPRDLVSQGSSQHMPNRKAKAPQTLAHRRLMGEFARMTVARRFPPKTSAFANRKFYARSLKVSLKASLKLSLKASLKLSPKVQMNTHNAAGTTTALVGGLKPKRVSRKTLRTRTLIHYPPDHSPSKSAIPTAQTTTSTSGAMPWKNPLASSALLDLDDGPRLIL